MKVSEQGIELIKQLEGFSDVAYPDPGTGGAPFTCGYGRAHNVKPDQRCDRMQADYWLRHQDAPRAAECVNNHVKRPLKQQEFDALVSFVYNVGCGNFRNSTMLKLLNQGNKKAAAAEFGKWVYAAHKQLPGLVKRRARERDVFDHGYL